MLYKIIVATDINKGIGLQNKLPWNIKEDMSKFVNLSKGKGNNAIIMGKNTWESLPNKPLKDRYNIVLSTTLEDSDKFTKTKFLNNIDDIIKFCDNKFEEIWIIGGEQIYKLFLEKNLIEEIYITEINKDYNCDRFFPELSKTNWKLIKSENVKIENDTNFKVNNFRVTNLCNKIYKKI